MEIAALLSLIVHVSAGILTLLAGPVAIFYNFKDPRRHKMAGKVFFYAMLVVVFTTWLGFLKRPDQLFFQFLLGVSIFVLASTLRAVRAIRFMKGASLQKYDYAYTLILGLFGVWMLYMAGSLAIAGKMVALMILFGFFGLGALYDTFTNLRLFARFKEQAPQVWYRMHVGTMLGAFTASTTAFTVNAAHFLPWYLQWFGPTIVLVPLQIYFGRKIKKKEVVRGDEGIAVQSVSIR